MDLGAQNSVESFRHLKKGDDPGQIVDMARQMEGVFLGMLFNEMAKTVPKENGLFPASPGRDLYEEWFRSEVAKEWASGGGTGLGNTIAKSLGVDSDMLDAHRINTFRGPDYIRTNARIRNQGLRNHSRENLSQRFQDSLPVSPEKTPEATPASNLF